MTYQKYHLCNEYFFEPITCRDCRSDNKLIYKIKDKQIICKGCPEATFKDLDDTNYDYLYDVCRFCNEEFQGKLKIFNRLEKREIDNAVRNSLFIQERAKPPSGLLVSNCCKTFFEKNQTSYFHNITCKGLVYLGELNFNKIIVCGDCKYICDFDKFFWTCPLCLKYDCKDKYLNDLLGKRFQETTNKRINQSKLNNSYYAYTIMSENKLIDEQEEVIEPKRRHKTDYVKLKTKIDQNALKKIAFEDLQNIKSNIKKFNEEEVFKTKTNTKTHKDQHNYNTEVSELHLNNINNNTSINNNISTAERSTHKSNDSKNNIYSNNNIKSSEINNSKSNSNRDRENININININVNPCFTSNLNMTEKQIEKNSMNINMLEENFEADIAKLQALRIRNLTQYQKGSYSNINKHTLKKENDDENINNKLAKSPRFYMKNCEDNRNINADNNNKIKNSKNECNNNYNANETNNHLNNHDLSLNVNINSNKTKTNKKIIFSNVIKTDESDFKTNNEFCKLESLSTLISTRDLQAYLNEPKCVGNSINNNTNSSSDNQNAKISDISEYNSKTPKVTPKSKLLLHNNEFKVVESCIADKAKKAPGQKNMLNFNSKLNNININNLIINGNVNNNIRNSNNNINQLNNFLSKNFMSNKNLINPMFGSTKESDPSDGQSVKKIYMNRKCIPRMSEIKINASLGEFNHEDYKIISKIGEGSFGQIYHVEDKLTRSYCMKKIISSDLKNLSIFAQEYEIVNKIRHENVLRIYSICRRKLDNTTYVLYILMEKAITDWDREIKARAMQKKFYCEEDLLIILKQCVDALCFLQINNISHRDIKPQNILLFKEGIFKMADFGEAKKLKESQIQNKNFNTLRGTELYMSPLLYEGLRKNLADIKHNPYKSDVFSLGLCFFYGATLNINNLYDIREIFDSNLLNMKIKKILKLNNFSEFFIQIIQLMLELNEDKRYDFIDLQKLLVKNGVW